MDWRVKTPSISGPMESVSVPWIIVGGIALTMGSVFIVSSAIYDKTSSVAITFILGFFLWVMASAKTRQDRDWANVLLDKVKCKGRFLLMYMWNKYYWRWPA